MLFIIGPCALETIEQVKPIVSLCKKYEIKHFRAQLFKPRTRAHSFQGLGLSKQGLDIITYLKSEKMAIVSEAASIEQLESIISFADIVQIGARNMQNFELLKNVGKILKNASQEKPDSQFPCVMLKRGFANTLEEWLASANYLEIGGVPSSHIILCERGTRNFSSPTGITLDLAMAYKAQQISKYRVIVDPSHGTRERGLVIPLTKASIAIGVDGVMIEVHPKPWESVSDPAQALSIEELDAYLAVNFAK
ncbi:MAG: 3-deoxy-7-phosphoheptulonate synthase [Oligoflexia bacterium]|nr:3-deoxy-7-phosphoheptulonate synthase [Oligoflexia bacterium]MBF0366551.1 3-deoxy-7-phosphoheptulonate synthase [Oligoflexia bacterium]